MKNAIAGMDVPETDFGNISKSPQLGVFDFRAFLNLAMLMRESERAALLRKAILDIVIDMINQKTGGSTKYINQRDQDFYQNENYRKEFTDALRDYVDMENFKYPLYMENISYHVAAGKIDKDLLHEIITAFLAEELNSEELKLKIYHAICEQ